ncbi:unnamed protein product, partial [Prorocentrum cordatum]
QVRFIREYDPGQLRQAGASADELLGQAGFERLAPRPAEAEGEHAAASFDYLLGLPFHALSPERAEKLEADLRDTEERLAALEQTSEDSMWISDLDDFREAYRREHGLAQGSGERRRKAQTPAFPAAAGKEWEEAQSLFDRGRRKSRPSRPPAPKAQAKRMTSTPTELQKMSHTQLNLVIRECGLRRVPRTSNKMQKIKSMLSIADLGYTGKLKTNDLRAHLEARGLPTAGLKPELRERLQQWVRRHKE